MILYFLFSIIVFVQSSSVLEHPLARYWVLTCTGQMGAQQEVCRETIHVCISQCSGYKDCEECVLNNSAAAICNQCIHDLSQFGTKTLDIDGKNYTVLTDMDQMCTPINEGLCKFACLIKFDVYGECKSFPTRPTTECLCDTSVPSSIDNPFAEFLPENGVDLVNLIGFPADTKWSLIYQGSRDGFSSSSFHDKCDNVVKTLTIVNVNSDFNYTFGGYTEQTWDSSNTFKKDLNAFIFSLRNRNNASYKFNIKSSGTEAIFCQRFSGPKFGGPNNFDIVIAHEANNNTASYSELGSNYNIDGQLPHNEIDAFIAGSFQFKLHDIAVYKMISMSLSWIQTCTVGPQEKCRQFLNSCSSSCFGPSCETCVLSQAINCKQCFDDLKEFNESFMTIDNKKQAVLVNMDEMCTPENEALCIFSCYYKLKMQGYCQSFINSPTPRCLCI
jgi:hypothetical protein